MPAKTCLEGVMSVLWEGSYCTMVGMMQLLTYMINPVLTKSCLSKTAREHQGTTVLIQYSFSSECSFYMM